MQHPASRAFFAVSCATCFAAMLGLAGCSGTEPKPTSTSRIGVQVYISDGAVQCEAGSQPLSATAQQLNDIGIEVLSSQCATLTDVAFASVCGGGTPGIHIHTITTSQLDGARRFGYEPVSNLATSDGPGYQFTPCSQ